MISVCYIGFSLLRDEQPHWIEYQDLSTLDVLNYVFDGLIVRGIESILSKLFHKIANICYINLLQVINMHLMCVCRSNYYSPALKKWGLYWIHPVLP